MEKAPSLRSLCGLTRDFIIKSTAILPTIGPGFARLRLPQDLLTRLSLCGRLRWVTLSDLWRKMAKTETSTPS